MNDNELFPSPLESNEGVSPRSMQLDLPFQEDHRTHVSKWNNPTPTQADATVHGLVLSMAQSNPEAEAICSWDGSLSYKEMEELSNRLAYRLIQMGIKKGAYVAYAFEKSLWAVVAMLGILKAGAAFVALEPTQSTERLQSLQQILGCSMIVTSELHASTIETLCLRTLVLPKDILSTDQDKVSSPCDDQPVVESNDAAVILFTSGSTGQPKAILHEHGSICSHATALGDALGYRCARVLQFSAYTWDVAVMDIFVTLIHGGCVCIPSEDNRVNNIARFISWSRSDLALLTPSFARTIDPQTVPSLKTLALAGECMTREDVHRWADRVTLINAYGPAEVGVCAVNVLKVGNQRPEKIGRSLPNSPCWIVNPENDNELLPPGAIGELVVAGPNLALGYLNHPDPTSDPFIVSPAWAVKLNLQYSRFYKTGDLVSYDLDTLDGSMVFLGRKDDQIKIRGQRVEPGEVEYHLNKLPEVNRSIVMMPHRGFWKGELIAVVQTLSSQPCPLRLDSPGIQSGDDVLLSKIQGHIHRYLPQYMIPTACFMAPNLPMTMSMKIDRQRVKGWIESDDPTMRLMKKHRSMNDHKEALGSSENTAWGVSYAVDVYIGSINTDRRFSITGYNVALNDLGLDSIQIITLFSTLRNRFGNALPFQAVLKAGMTIRDVAQLIDSPAVQSTGNHDVNHLVLIESETRSISTQMLRMLHSREISHPGNTQHSIRNIFLTGATGYLGRRIFRQLLTEEELHIYVHLRRHYENASTDPLRDIGLRDGWWDESFTSRYTIWTGDLSKPAIGLDQQHLDLLEGRGPPSKVVNGIIHCGAVVHYSLDYSSLRQANVISTTTLLEATAVSPFLQTFVFISGGTKSSMIKDGKADERALWNGYSQSKHVCEQIIQAANEDLIFGNKHTEIVHPGYIIGPLKDGIANTNDFFWRMIAGCIEIGTYNKDESDQWVSVSDVATVSQVAVAALFWGRRRPDDPECRIPTEGIRFQDIWNTLQHEFGYNLVGINGDQWLSSLKDAILRTGESHNLFPLLPTLEIQGRTIGDRSDLTTTSNTTIMECMRMNIKYLISIGFFPQPQSISPAISTA